MAPIFNVPIMDPVFVYEQSSMEVGCDILGGPLPTVTWLKGNAMVRNVYVITNLLLAPLI